MPIILSNASGEDTGIGEGAQPPDTSALNVLVNGAQAIASHHNEVKVAPCQPLTSPSLESQAPHLTEQLTMQMMTLMSMLQAAASREVDKQLPSM